MWIMFGRFHVCANTARARVRRAAVSARLTAASGVASRLGARGAAASPCGSSPEARFGARCGAAAVGSRLPVFVWARPPRASGASGDPRALITAVTPRAVSGDSLKSAASAEAAWRARNRGLRHIIRLLAERACGVNLGLCGRSAGWYIGRIADWHRIWLGVPMLELAASGGGGLLKRRRGRVLSKCACMLAFAPPRTPPAARRAAVRPAAMRLERCAAAPVARASAGARRDAPVVRGRRSVRTRRVVLQVFSL